ncbi:hypothetical protein SAMN02990966_04392 [Rhodospirillales bacterium URHD0017]|nr:hypothetical protein SAMN02990966_04392 [Rhodospirillales bacterium URHD0017]
MTSSRKRPATDSLPVIPAAPPAWSPGDARPPRRATPARLQTYFLRRLAISGSVAEAAAQAGTTPRTVRRWRAANVAFARRYEETLGGRLEILEDLAMRRALGADRRPVFHRGKQIASVERHNDVMLMRLLARFDRLREREALQARALSGGGQDDIDDIALLDAASERARHQDIPSEREEE